MKKTFITNLFVLFYLFAAYATLGFSHPLDDPIIGIRHIDTNNPEGLRLPNGITTDTPQLAVNLVALDVVISEISRNNNLNSLNDTLKFIRDSFVSKVEISINGTNCDFAAKILSTKTETKLSLWLTATNCIQLTM